MTGQSDVPLTQLGIQQARDAASVIADIDLHIGYTSQLQRAHETLRHILESAGRPDIPVTRNAALNERHFGIYEGRIIKEVESELGKEQTTLIRHGWNEPIPEGETLKQTHARVKPYFDQHILADLMAGNNVIMALHGIVLRTIVKDLDRIPDDEIQKLHFGNAEVNVYEIDPADGSVISKEIRVAGHSS